MPLINTTGAASAKGFGLFAKKASSALNIAIFAQGYNTTSTAKYNFTTESMANATNLTSIMNNGTAATNVSYGLFQTGTPTMKYTFATNATSAGTTLSSGSGYGAAIQNATYSIWSSSGMAAQKYTWASNAITTATAFATVGGGYPSEAQNAPGNSSFGLMPYGGYINISKYTYSGETTSSTTSLTAYLSIGCGTGNASYAIWALGRNNTSTTNKWVYSNSSNASSTALVYNFGYNGAASNSTTALFGSTSFSLVSTKWTFSNDSTTAGTNFSYSSGTENSGMSGVTANWPGVIN